MPENLYRKWRPRAFAELAGQEHVTTTLVNALAGGHVAHAYLFAGPRGTGKTTTGRLLAKALNCREREHGEPCNRCESCLSYLSGRALDLIELDAASNRGIDEIRSLREKVAFAAGAGDFKVYLIDEVHMLTDAAFNALLKTLEEPPPHVVFVLATTDAHRVPATIVSRCQRFDFRRISVVAAVKCLQTICAAEAFTASDGALELIARASTGSMRDAENLLEQLVTSYGLELTIEHVRAGLGLIDDPRAPELARLALGGDLGQGLALIAGVRDDGLDLRQFQREVVSHLRTLVLVKSGAPPVEGFTAEQQKEMAASVAAAPVAVVLGALKAFGEADLKPDPNSTLPLDLALADCVLSRSAPPAAPVQPPSSASAARPPMTFERQAAAKAATDEREAAAKEATEPAGPVRAAPSDPAERGRRSAAAPARGERASPQAPPSVAPVRVSEKQSAAKPATDREGSNEALDKGAPPVAIDRDSLRDLLPKIYEEVRKRQVNVGALLNSECDIIEATENEVVFGFRFENLARKTAEVQNVKLIAEVISQAVQRPMTVRCVADAGVSSWRKREPSRSPLVRAAQEMGARIL